MGNKVERKVHIVKLILTIFFQMRLQSWIQKSSYH